MQLLWEVILIFHQIMELLDHHQVDGLLQVVEELVDHLMEQVVLNLMVEEEQENKILEMTETLLQIQVQVVEDMLQ